jgi:hypothetical protein
MSIREQIEYALAQMRLTNEQIAMAVNLPVTVINSIETDMGLDNEF